MWGEGRFGAGLGVRQGRPPGQGPGGGMGGANHSPFETIAYLPGTVTAPSRGGPALTFLLLWISPDPSPKPRQARPPPGRGRPPPLAEPAGPARARARGGQERSIGCPKQKNFWPTCASRRPGPDERCRRTAPSPSSEALDRTPPWGIGDAHFSASGPRPFSPATIQASWALQ